MTLITLQDFIASYNHTLSSVFTPSTLPFVHHSYNWSDCTNFITAEASFIALSPDESLLAVAVGSDVLVYNTEGDMGLNYKLRGHMGVVTQVEWFPDGAGRKLVSGSRADMNYSKRIVRIWDLGLENASDFVSIALAGIPTLQPSDSSFERQHALPITNNINLEGVAKHTTAAAAGELVSRVGWTSDDVSATKLESLFLSALHEAHIERSLLHGSTFAGELPGFGSSCLSPDGNLLFYLPSRDTIAVISTSDRQEKFRLEGHADAVTNMWVGASPDGKFVATSSWDNTVRIWDLQDGKLVRTLEGVGQFWTGSWSPDSRLIAVGSGDRHIYIWDVISGEKVHVLGGKGMFSDWVRGLSFDRHNGNHIVGSSGGTVRVFDTSSGQCTNLYQIDPIASSPLGMSAFMEIGATLTHAPSPSGRFGFKPTDGRLVVYDGERNEMWEFVQDKEGSARVFGSGTFVFANGGKRVYSRDVDGKVRVWDLE